MSYENETCEGCVWLGAPNSDPSDRTIRGLRRCDKQSGFETVRTHPAYGGGHDCQHFHPTLACRQVRALEKLAQCVAADINTLCVSTYEGQ